MRTIFTFPVWLWALPKPPVTQTPVDAMPVCVPLAQWQEAANDDKMFHNKTTA